MIPFAAIVYWRGTCTRDHRLWVPLFLVWILLLPLLAVLFPLVFVIGLCIRIHAGKLYLAAWQILTSLRKTLIEIENPGICLKIRIV